MDIRQKLLVAFHQEHREYLHVIRGLLSDFERGDLGSSGFEDAIRLAHNLKGAARAVDLPCVEQTAAQLEELFKALDKEPGDPARELIETIATMLDAIEETASAALGSDAPPAAATVETPAGLPATPAVTPEVGHGSSVTDDEFAKEGRSPDGAPVAPPERATSRLEAVESPDLHARILAAFEVEQREHLERIRAFLAAGADARATDDLDDAFRRAHSLKGAARACGFSAVQDLAHRMESLFAEVREGKRELDPHACSEVEALLDRIDDEPSIRKETAPAADGGKAAPVPIDQVRIQASSLDRMLDSAGQLTTECMGRDALTTELRDVGRRLAGVEKEWESVRQGLGGRLRALEADPDYRRVAQYLDHVEHEVRALRRRTADVRRRHERSAWSLKRLGHQLQQEVRQARMTPVENVFQGFRKMVRDLATDQQKAVAFQATGFAVCADRMVLQTLKDPIMHILRNAVSHGLETSEERRREGKAERGELRLDFAHLGNRLRVTIEDDGRGIDRDRVMRRAIEAGLINETEDAHRDLKAETVSRVLFHPGFSTRDRVDDVSGRGMGLSVVDEAMTELQGDATIEERDGPGTRFVLTAPLAVSTHRVLLVKVDGAVFALPTHAVERLLRLRVGEVQTVEGRPHIPFEETLIPLQGLGQLLGSCSGGAVVDGDTLNVVIVRSGVRQVAAAVDEFVHERDAFLKKLDPPASHLRHLAGAILLEDGSVALVLNATDLVEGMRLSEGGTPFRPRDVVVEKQATSVLVVDDSFTTRTLETSILETHGYDVEVAVDGVEALQKLRSRRVDLVVSDVEMPRLDGFELLEAMKADQGLASTPVILVTSLDKPEHRRRGLELGADAYIVKQRFDHQELLSTIRQILGEASR